MKYNTKTTRWTSDLHLFHKNILKFNRDTRDGVDMDEMIRIFVKNWNAEVFPQDDVFILGDVTFGSTEDTIAVLKRLNGRLRLVLGNHDHKIYKSDDLKDCFELVTNYHEIEVTDGANEYRVVMMHYPIESWNRAHYGAIHLHGHTHGHYGDVNMKNRFDVGVDNRKDVKMTPFTWDDIMNRLAAYVDNSSDTERRTNVII